MAICQKALKGVDGANKARMAYSKKLNGTLEYEGQVPIKPYNCCFSRVFQASVCIAACPYIQSSDSDTQAASERLI